MTMQNRDKQSGKFAKNHAKRLTDPCYVRLDQTVSRDIRAAAKARGKSLSEFVQVALERYLEAGDSDGTVATPTPKPRFR